MNYVVGLALVCTSLMLAQCSGNGQSKKTGSESQEHQAANELLPRPEGFFIGADLSYVNEMEDCGAQYYINNLPKDPYQLFADKGSNLVRVRLWNNPKWTNYSNITDVSETIARSQASGQKVLLDFHYSDTWADPQKQFVPQAWESLIANDTALGDALYAYTYTTLEHLLAQNTLPEFVQIGNEINSEILQLASDMNTETINWRRNALLLNRGLEAVAHFNEANATQVQRMLHVAQPENALWWFAEANNAGINDYEWIGISWYPKWSSYSLSSLPQAIEGLRTNYSKKVAVIETAYPWTMENFDKATNILGADSLIPEFPATASGQLAFMQALVSAVIAGGGSGVIYWEPAWVSTSCSTPWGQGSHWENATFFDENNNALPGMEIFQYGL